MSKSKDIEKRADLYRGIPMKIPVSRKVKVLVDALNSVCTDDVALPFCSEGCACRW